jgi:cytidyltransferase-like protein
MIIDLRSLPEIRGQHNDETIAFAGGVFDLLHPGHLDLFRRMKSVADFAVVALSSDIRVKQRKGNLRPIQDQSTRLEIVSEIRLVDYALIAPEPSEEEVPTVQIMRALHPEYFLTSETTWYDFPDVFDELGVILHVVPRFSDEISTSQTIQRVLDSHA